MQDFRPGVLSIAGYDASGGAGVLADVKTFEALGVAACAVTTGITYQNDVEFLGVKWLENEEIKAQLQPLFNKFSFAYAKIGLLKDFPQLLYMVEIFKNHNPEIKIIWDPILKASAGFEFHADEDFPHIYNVLKMLHLVTPNRLETSIFGNFSSPEEACKAASKHCAVLLKGGHAEGANATDLLYIDGAENPEGSGQVALDSLRIEGAAKHGSGCVLSSAITAYLAKGEDLFTACAKGKQYITQFIKSTPHLLGMHNFSQPNESIFTH